MVKEVDGYRHTNKNVLGARVWLGSINAMKK